MSSGPNPAIDGEAIRRALTTKQVDAANLQDAIIERAALDEAELRDLERAEYYAEMPTVTTPGPTPVGSHRSTVDRLLRPGSR